MIRMVLVVMAMVVSLGRAPAAGAAGERPSEADLARCVEVARAAIPGLAYEERAPASPFPRQISGIGGYTGPVTSVEAWVFAVPGPPPAMRHPSLSGIFGAGGFSQVASSEPGQVDPRRQETFDACLRALLESPETPPVQPAPR